jgi:hypothetical protein
MLFAAAAARREPRRQCARTLAFAKRVTAKTFRDVQIDSPR